VFAMTVGVSSSSLTWLEWSRARHAKLFELPASTSLARLWRDQGRHAAARNLLAPVYAWFTECSDVPDLKEAKSLLDTIQHRQ
jgi:predicted ATPase